MNPILRNILAIVAGVIIGGMVNMSIVSVSGSVVPLPEGVDPNDMESIRANIHRFSIANYIMPFLAHALGTLVGAIIAVIIGASHHMRLALIVGIIYLILGIITNFFMLPESALWFKILDTGAAYVPMGWLGWKLASGKNEG